MDRLLLFSTPVAVIPANPELSELNGELAARMIAESTESDGFPRSNVGGWHSVPDLSLRQDPLWQALMRHIVDSVQEVFVGLASAAGVGGQLSADWSVQAWAMVMRDGDYTVVHDHSESGFSIAYYLDAGDADLERFPESGGLVLVDPRRGSSQMSGIDLSPTSFTVQPQTGMMVVFPGWLQHYVHAYRGQRPRVAVSANLSVTFAPVSE